jgi:hypothetical protein
MALGTLIIAVLALLVGLTALIAVGGIVVYLRWDYRVSRTAGSIVQAAIETLAPTQFPMRPKR